MKTGSSTTWIILLAVVVVLAVLSGMWAIDTAIRVILYVALAALAVWAVVMLLRAGRSGGHSHI